MNKQKNNNQVPASAAPLVSKRIQSYIPPSGWKTLFAAAVGTILQEVVDCYTADTFRSPGGEIPVPVHR